MKPSSFLLSGRASSPYGPPGFLLWHLGGALRGYPVEPAAKGQPALDSGFIRGINTGMAEGPRVAFQSGRMRFFDKSGHAFTVYDVARVGGRIRRTALAAGTATWRVFVGSDGRRHAYRFRRGEARELDPELLDQQLNGARWSTVFRPNRNSRR